MSDFMRKIYLDHLRWMSILLLIPYHAAMAWNVWGEPNYIFFKGSRVISSLVVFLSPYFMPLLFLIAGISTKAALQKRTIRQYLLERMKKLLVPFVSGTVLMMPVMSYIADRFQGGYEGSLSGHFCIFFTRFTDLTGADGGFSVGHFWFVLYLFFISLLSAGVITLQKKRKPECCLDLSLFRICLFGLPLPFLHELLSIGGKSFAEYMYLFLAGYFVFSNECTVGRLERYRWFFLSTGLLASVFHVYLSIWSGRAYPLADFAMRYISEWFMPAALLGMGKRYFTGNGKVSRYLSRRSFAFYVMHYLWVVLLQYLLADICGSSMFLMFVLPVLGAYGATFVCCELWARVQAFVHRFTAIKLF